MYDKVETHGYLHRLRMEDVFWTRTRVMLKSIQLIVLSLPNNGRTDQQNSTIMKVWRELVEDLFPGQQKAQQDWMAEMKQRVQRELDLGPIEVVAKDEDHGYGR